MYECNVKLNLYYVQVFNVESVMFCSVLILIVIMFVLLCPVQQGDILFRKSAKFEPNLQTKVLIAVLTLGKYRLSWSCLPQVLYIRHKITEKYANCSMN